MGMKWVFRSLLFLVSLGFLGAIAGTLLMVIVIN